ncbi:MAG TPA: bifunctional 3-deoxy-7-phosphoheptulonate synthase/chorismate mutase [Ruminiclostridium sp.]|nr:bifunctional 3-deoxy-7-phosphoheptulonate synthase/chorismate mutase [Ruminiclostridium sp.]
MGAGSKVLKINAESTDCINMEQLEEDLNKLELIRSRLSADVSDWYNTMESINLQDSELISKRGRVKNKEDMVEDLASRLNTDIDQKKVKKLLKFVTNSSLSNVQPQKEPQNIGTSLKKIFDGENLGLPLIAGPCAIESKPQMKAVGKKLNELGIKFLRGGAYKPRTSPYDFQGYGLNALKLLHETGGEFGLKTVSEVVDTRNVEAMENYVDVFQVGSRNMFNYELLKEIGKSKRPVILKRGLMATIKEYIYAAEYIRLGGNENIILCERGIRTFDTVTRNTLDIAAVPILKKETGLPVVVDLSHALGRKDLVIPLGSACLVAGADLLMVEVHPNPRTALSDSKQQLNFMELQYLVNSISRTIKKFLMM